MVDPVGFKAAGAIRAARVDAPRPIRAPMRENVARAPAGFGGVARDLAARPPVDMDRVQRIRRAVAEGKFPILPATIADRLLALKMNWNGNDPA